MQSKRKKEISLEWLKTPKGQDYLTKSMDILVFLRSDNGFWRPNQCGYTDRYECRGIYTLKDAYLATNHCGPEKCVRYIPVTVGPLIEALALLTERTHYLTDHLHNLLNQ